MGESVSTSGMPWVVIYTHRHGTDVWAEGTRELAMLSLLDTVLGYTYELDEEARENFLRLAADGKFSDAVFAYFSFMEEEEDFEIYQLNKSDPPSEQGIRERAQAELEELLGDANEQESECLNPDYVLKYQLFTGEPAIVIKAMGRSVMRGGQDRVEYRVEVLQGGKVIFPYGQLYCSPGPGFTEDQTKALITELVAMSPDGGHGVDDDYFARYTDEQKAWANRHGDALGLEARVLEEGVE